MKVLYKGVCMADCITATGSTAPANGILFANDPDCTYMNFAKENGDALRTWHSFVGLLNGLALTSDMIHREDADRLRNMAIPSPPAPDKGWAFDGQTDPWHRRFGFIAKRPSCPRPLPLRLRSNNPKLI